MMNVMGSASTSHWHLGKGHPVVGSPDNVMPTVFLDEKDRPERDEDPEGERVRSIHADRHEQLADDDDRVLKGMYPAARPAEGGVIGMVHAVNILPKVRDNVHDAVLPIDEKISNHEHQQHFSHQLQN